MKRFILIALLSIGFAPASAEPREATSCSPSDKYEIRDDGPGRAIVSFYNSEAKCSIRKIDMILISDDGITVRVIMNPNPSGAGNAERLEVVPQDPNMMAHPPFIDAEDGETVEIIVQGGMS